MRCFSFSARPCVCMPYVSVLRTIAFHIISFILFVSVLKVGIFLLMTCHDCLAFSSLASIALQLVRFIFISYSIAFPVVRICTLSKGCGSPAVSFPCSFFSRDDVHSSPINIYISRVRDYGVVL